MNQIIMHRGGEPVTRDQLDLIPMPEPTESYVPVSQPSAGTSFGITP